MSGVKCLLSPNTVSRAAPPHPRAPMPAPALFGREVLVPPAGEYVADGAAKQAAWALLGEMPTWDLGNVVHHKSTSTPQVMDKYRTLRDNTTSW